MGRRSPCSRRAPGACLNVNATNSIAISPDSTRAVVASASGQFDVYNLTTTVPTVIVSYNETQNPQDVGVTPDGRFAVLQDPAHTTIVRLADGAKVAVFTPRSWGFQQLNATNTIAVSPDGTRAAVASASGQFDVYNLTTATPTVIASYNEAQNPQDVEVTPDGRLAVLQDPAHITIVRLADGAKVGVFTPRIWGFPQLNATNTIAVSPDGTRAAVASASGQFDVYDLAAAPPSRIATYDEAQNPQDVAIARVQRSPSTNLTLSGTVAPNPASTGTPITYSLALRNAGPLPATGVRLVDSLPDGISLVSAEATQGSCSVRLALVCDVGDVPVDCHRADHDCRDRRSSGHGHEQRDRCRQRTGHVPRRQHGDAGDGDTSESSADQHERRRRGPGGRAARRQRARERQRP